MKKILKGLVTFVAFAACFGAFAFGGATKASADLYYDSKVELEGRTPECALVLEEAKIKNMTDWGYYNVDGEDVWYFSGDDVGGEGKNPEIRFVTDGTQTKTKPYTYAPMQVDRFSFSYRIDNKSNHKGVDDLDTQYIVQILCSDGSYPIILPEINADGGWHTIYVDEFTRVSNAFVVASTYGGVDDLFCGFLFKMAGLDGELMISNIEIVSNGAVLEPLNPYEEPEVPETSEEDSSVDSVPVESEVPEESEDIYLESEWEEPASDSLWFDTEEEGSAVESVTSEEEGVLAMFGCGSVTSGISTVLALAGVGFVMAVSKKKE